MADFSPAPRVSPPGYVEAVVPPERATVGTFIARRLLEAGAKEYFAVAGDYTLALLDELAELRPHGLEPVFCCSELGAGYAADGAARGRGLGVCVVTFTVGGLSLINAVAGAYAEALPLIVLSGAPNSNDYASDRVLHHTIGLSEDFDQQRQAFKAVTDKQVLIRSLDEAAPKISETIVHALTVRRPVLIEVCCNVAGLCHHSFESPVPPMAMVWQTQANALSTKAAAEAVANAVNGAYKVGIVAGVQLRHDERSQEEFLRLAESLRAPVAVAPDAKGLFPEDHELFIGTFWGVVSEPALVASTIEAADIVIFVGAVSNDYTEVGYTLALPARKVVRVGLHRAVVGPTGAVFSGTCIPELLAAVSRLVKPNDTSLVMHRNMASAVASQSLEESCADEHEALTTRVLRAHLQRHLSPTSCVVAETGDSWFQTQKLHLPHGAKYEIQLQYGSIGWSVGATLGLSRVLTERRVVSLIGDGAFQCAPQELSTIIRYKQNPIVVLVNNSGYGIEVQIHDGPYNAVQPWSYTGVAKAFDAEGAAFVARCTTGGELREALAAAFEEHDDKPCFIEAVVGKDDCTAELLSWGTRVAAANSRPPVPA